MPQRQPQVPADEKEKLRNTSASFGRTMMMESESSNAVDCLSRGSPKTARSVCRREANMDMSVVIIVVLIAIGVFGVWLRHAATEEGVGDGSLIRRPAAFYHDQFDYELRGADFDRVHEAVLAVVREGGMGITEMKHNHTSSMTFEGSYTARFYMPDASDPGHWRFLLTHYRTNRSGSFTETIEVNRLLTGIEKALLEIDPLTTVTEHYNEMKTHTNLV